MPIDIYQNPEPASHYEFVVLKDDRNFINQQVKQKAFNYMNQLEGWCSHNKASLLIDFILMLEPETLVEIGVFGGKSLIPMAVALKSVGKGKIYGIDPWDSLESVAGMEGENFDWWGHIDHEKILQGLRSKIVQFALEDQILLLRTTSEQAPYIPNIDILHIDGNHSEKAAYLDVNKWVPFVKKGGLIIFDDVTWGTNRSAVEWLDENCIKLVEFHEFNDWGIWIKS
jgi:predicted O-methyltransferase YrrM